MLKTTESKATKLFIESNPNTSISKGPIASLGIVISMIVVPVVIVESLTLTPIEELPLKSTNRFIEKSELISTSITWLGLAWLILVGEMISRLASVVLVEILVLVKFS